MHATPQATMHTPNPPGQSCMPPQEQPRMPPRATMHVPQEQPHMPPEQPHTPPRATMHVPPLTESQTGVKT